MFLDNVTGARMYSFQDKESGRQVEGVNVFFMQKAVQSEEVGEIPQKVSLPINTWEKIRKLPFPVAGELIVQERFTSRGIKSQAIDFERSLDTKKAF